MRPWRAAAILTAAAACAGIATASASASEPPAIADLRVSGGEASWHPVNDFRLDWDRAAGQPPAAAVHYRVRDESGEVVLPAKRIAGEVELISHIHLPSGPGLYRAEVWLEGLQGEAGPIAAAALRFDDVAPGPARLLAPAGWVSGRSPTVARIEPPATPLPISGIRGYAISVDRGTPRPPCAAAPCTPAETDLSGGIGADTISLGLLPEGLSFARVVAVSGSGVPSAKVESTTLRVDASYPTLALRGAPHGWSDSPVRLTATASDALSGVRAAGPTGPYTAIAIGDRAASIAPGDAVSTTVRGEGAHEIAFYARDAAGNVADGRAGAPAPARAVVRIDETPPRVTFARAQAASEPERIEATVTDALSGPDPGRGTIAVRPAGTGQRFVPLTTAISVGRLVAHWDSDRYPPGRYEFRATGFDSAGNPAGGDRRLGGARMVLPNPLKRPTELVSRFAGRPPASKLVPYGRGAAFRGRLGSATGSPLGDLPVVVTETFAAGAEPASRETVTRTRADGTFLVRLAPGPSRRVKAHFAGNRLLSGSDGRPAWFGVRSSVRLRASAAIAVVGGAPIELSGRVGQLGTSIPAGGMPVELQFRLPGAGWSEFRTVQTDAAGRFRYSYAFTDDDSRGVRFQFRAFLPEIDGWPYEPAPSRPVLITGR